MGSDRALGNFAAGLAVAVWSLFSLATSAAEHEERGPHTVGHVEARHDGPAFHGDIGRFHEHDWALWYGGRWEHGYHGGRLGWWWVAGGLWYFYPFPVYPYPDPFVPPVLLPAPTAEPGPLPPAPTPSHWYYCNSARGYYPYVTSCPEPWQAVPANSTPAGPAAPANPVPGAPAAVPK